MNLLIPYPDPGMTIPKNRYKQVPIIRFSDPISVYNKKEGGTGNVVLYERNERTPINLVIF